MLKFCANLALMFSEVPFLERYQLAKEAGFKAVETGFPFNLTLQQVIEAKNLAGIDQILLNIFTGDVTKGELGFACIPGKEAEFKKSLETTIEYGKALGVKKIHIMAGRVHEQITEDHDLVYENNLRYAANLLSKENIVGLIEPINKHSIPHYYLNSYDKALSVVKRINNPNLRIMLDTFHLQQIKGDITHTMNELNNYVGHIQIAQVPNRNEPDTPGEINYRYIFDTIKRSGYTDWIGLEYIPLNNTIDGLKWIKNYGFSL